MSFLDNENERDGVQDMGALLESMFVDLVNHMDDEERVQYLESAEVKALV